MRAAIQDFALANPIYAGASVSFYTVSAGVKTSTLATLYSGATGTGTLTNPQILDSEGKFQQPVYPSAPVIGAITGLSIPDHDTGIITGPWSGDASLEFAFDSSTTMADPGTGDIRLNHATLSSVTSIAISALVASTGNADVSDYLASVDDSTNTAHKGTLILREPGASTLAIFTITGVTDNGTWLQIAVTYVSATGTLTAGDVLFAAFIRTGNIGAIGLTGGTGVVGVDIQPYDDTLTALAALTIAANSLTIGTGADAFSQTTFGANTFPARASTGNLLAKTLTDFALTLLDDADAVTVRATLGLIIGTNVAAYNANAAFLNVAQLWAADQTLDENVGLYFDAALSADGKYSGICTTGTAGAVLAFGELCYFQTSDSRWEKSQAAAAQIATASLRLGMCVLAAAADGDPTKMLVLGKIRADALFPTMTIGAPVYMSAATAGVITSTAPTGTTDFTVRKIGFGVTGDELFFNPSNDYVTLA